MNRFEKQKRKFDDKKKLLNQGSQRAVGISLEGRKMALWCWYFFTFFPFCEKVCYVHVSVTEAGRPYIWKSRIALWKNLEVFLQLNYFTFRCALYSTRLSCYWKWFFLPQRIIRIILHLVIPFKPKKYHVTTWLRNAQLTELFQRISLLLVNERQHKVELK